MSHLTMDSSPLVLLSILFLCFPLTFSKKPHALVVPVTKDPSTLQYIAKVNQRTPLVPVNLAVDLSAQYLWVDCDKGYVSSTYRPVRCKSAACFASNGVGCGNHCFSKARPGCNNNTCTVSLDNSFTRVTTEGELATDIFSVRSTDGSKVGPAVKDPKFIFRCAHTTLLEGLARGTTGIIGLGRSKVTPLEQLAATFRLEHTFAICLSSSSGVMFFGSRPYVFLPGVDVSISLSYTPLVDNPVSIYTPIGIPEYFIGVTSIEINGRPIKINGTLLQISKNGIGGTRISTVHPYTVLERSIYKAVLSAFGASLSQSQAKRVAPIAPFGLCYDANSIPYIARLQGPNVPSINLVLQGDSGSWSIIGANSMVSVGNALCLGFVDGGINPTTSIVIGGYQLEDNLLMFDLAKSRLGFSNNLVWSKIFCSNFNYTT